MITVSALATTLFLGGWRAPWPITRLVRAPNTGWWPVLWFLGKIAAVHVLVHLAARLAAADPLRPADEARLEGPHPGRAGLDAADRHHRGSGAARAAARRSTWWPAASSSSCSRWPGAGTSAARAGRPAEARRGGGRGRAECGRGGEDRRRAFPVPPLDLPHYHGIGVTPAVVGGPVAPGSAGEATVADTAKEVSPVPDFLNPVKGFGVTFRQMFRRSTPSSTRRRRSRPRPGSTAGTSSTAGRTGWRSASAASCAPGPARPTRSTSRAATTPRTSGTRPASGTAASTRSTTCAASCAGCASRRARPGR